MEQNKEPYHNHKVIKNEESGKDPKGFIQNFLENIPKALLYSIGKSINKEKMERIIETTPQKWNEMISNNIGTLKNMLDRIDHHLKLSIVPGPTKMQYIQPIQGMIYECFMDIVENGVSFEEEQEPIKEDKIE